MKRKTREQKPLKLDLGCGPNKREGFLGVDVRQFDGKVDIVADLARLRPGYERWYPFTRFLAGESSSDIFMPWPWKDGSVAEAHSSHFVEHLTAMERVHFINELHRVLAPGAKCQIITPHWASQRAYGDMTHQWPGSSEFWFYYLSKEWRKANAPHSNYSPTVDFEATWGYSMHPAVLSRNQEYQQEAMAWKKEACQDIIATLTKK